MDNRLTELGSMQLLDFLHVHGGTLHRNEFGNWKYVTEADGKSGKAYPPHGRGVTPWHAIKDNPSFKSNVRDQGSAPSTNPAEERTTE